MTDTISAPEKALGGALGRAIRRRDEGIETRGQLLDQLADTTAEIAEAEAAIEELSAALGDRKDVVLESYRLNMTSKTLETFYAPGGNE